MILLQDLRGVLVSSANGCCQTIYLEARFTLESSTEM